MAGCLAFIEQFYVNILDSPTSFFFFPLLFFKCLVLKMKLAKPYGQLKWIQEIQE